MVELVPYSCLTQQVSGEAYVNVREVYFQKLLAAALSTIEVDENWYRRRYTDIDNAIRSGLVRTAKEHYVVAGYFEGRMPRRIVVDHVWYLKTYSDVAEAIGSGRLHSAQEHFDAAGYGEGRLPSAGWRL
jgi:hypothetical protein